MTAPRGKLRIYLGAAPGVGKTFAMLDEGHRRAARGSDVVAAFVETHGRPRTAAKLAGLELVPRQEVAYRDGTFPELDLDAVLARRPQVALVDELAHTNVPGSGRHEKRWEDVEELLAAGIDVISTVNVQHLESLNDVVRQITGVPQRETVPDAMVRAAEQVELVDMTAEALRRRMAHGNIYAAEKVDAALGNYFREGNLNALRELALLWLADKVDDGLLRYREAHGISGTWETRERVVVALTGGPEGETLLRRGARIAARSSGGELLAVHVSRSDGLVGTGVARLATQRLLVESLGGSYHSVIGEDVPTALLDFSRGVNATQIVLGASRRRPWLAALTGPGTGATVIGSSDTIDVHLVTHEHVGRGRVAVRGSGLSRRRRVAGLAAAVLLLLVLTLVCTQLRSSLGPQSDLLLYLLAVVVISVIGGFWPALFAAAVGSLLANYYLIPPLHTLEITGHENVLAIAVFVVVAALVSRVVDVSARRSVAAARAGAEAETLGVLAGSVLRGEQALPALLERVKETFFADRVLLLRKRPDGSTELVAGLDESVGPVPSEGTEVPVGDAFILSLPGRLLPAADRRLLTAFGAQVAVAYEQRQLMQTALSVEAFAEADRLRTALLNAVSHDLRTPLATLQTALSSLSSTDVDWSAADRAELFRAAEDGLGRLTSLITGLLDLSRLQAGALPMLAVPVGLDDVVARALDHVAGDQDVDFDVPADLPEVLADGDLLERVVANLVQNAFRYEPDDVMVRVAGSAHAGRVQLRVIDHGRGIAEADREKVFAPFQRLGDTPHDGEGVGLGLAIARGLTEAMGGTVTVDDTPGGGATLVVDLPAAGLSARIAP